MSSTRFITTTNRCKNPSTAFDGHLLEEKERRIIPNMNFDVSTLQLRAFPTKMSNDNLCKWMMFVRNQRKGNGSDEMEIQNGVEFFLFNEDQS